MEITEIASLTPVAPQLNELDLQDQALRDQLIGRRRHLGSLALKFYHMGGTWGDLFKGAGFHVQNCRHNGPLGRHSSVLEAGLRDGPPMFNHERFRRPCRGFGKGDFNTTPGYIVHDLCNLAGDYLVRIGKGEKIETRG